MQSRVPFKDKYFHLAVLIESKKAQLGLRTSVLLTTIS